MFSGVLPAGFTIPDTVQFLYARTFDGAVAQLGFKIPDKARIYAPSGEASSYASFDMAGPTTTTTALVNIQIPPGTKWDKGAPVAGAAVFADAIAA